jgi:hypothetical protein
MSGTRVILVLLLIVIVIVGSGIDAKMQRTIKIDINMFVEYFASKVHGMSKNELNILNLFLMFHVNFSYDNNVLQLVFKMFKITYSCVVYFYYTWYSSELGNEKYGIS